MAKLLSGTKVAESLNQQIIREVQALLGFGCTPLLCIVRVGEKPDDLSYQRSAVKRCEKLGIKVRCLDLPGDISQENLVEELKALNQDQTVHGVLLLRPFPSQIREKELKGILMPQKDMDCFHPMNIAALMEGDPQGYAPCTPEAVMEILEKNDISLRGKKVVVLGRSMVVGKPLILMLLQKDATVTICHSKTEKLKEVCKNADILIVAIGKAKMIDESYVSEGAVVIDVGINVLEDGTLCGDVDFEKVERVASQITPVPGGVGAVTTSVLANHVVRAAKKSV